VVTFQPVVDEGCPTVDELVQIRETLRESRWTTSNVEADESE
jgi:hypothetical protein